MLEKKFFWIKTTFHLLQFTYPRASIKDFQATEEAFSPQKRASSTSKHEISKKFSCVGHVCPSGYGYWIRVHLPD
jgi:hypothetical protein